MAATLINAKHERFAQEIAKGTTTDEAYALAGYKKNRKNASRLKAKEGVRERIAELIGAGAEKAELDISQVLGELGKIGFANMLDYITIGEDGQPFLDFSKLTRDQAAAISELVVETTVQTELEGDKRVPINVRRVRFKLAPKTPSLELLGKHLGAFITEKLDITIGIGGRLEAALKRLGTSTG
jgi:phage terminase small subunit